MIVLKSYTQWSNIRLGNYSSRCTQGSILGPLFFIYINDLTNSLKSNVKLFADGTFLFSEICNLLESANVLNDDLRKNRKWAEQWKMIFKPDPTKQAQEVFFFLENHILRNILIYTLTILLLKK